MQIYLLVVGGIVLLGIFLFFILAFRSKNWRYDKAKNEDPLDHYKENRDKLTHRKDEPKEDEEDTKPHGNFIGGIVSIVVGIIVFCGIALPTMKSVNITGWGELEQYLWEVIGLVGIIGILYGFLNVFNIV